MYVSYIFVLYPRFSAYGENSFLMAQTFTIVLLVLLYSKQSLATGVFPVLYGVACFVLFSDTLPDRALYALQTANLPIMAVSKVSNCTEIGGILKSLLYTTCIP